MKDGDLTPEDRKIETIINRAIQELGENGCESIRIFVTYRSAGARNATAFTKGEGNSYAQYGQISKWLITEDEETKKESWEPEDDDDEDPGDAPKV